MASVRTLANRTHHTKDLDQLQSNFSIVGAQGLYSLNPPDFFYVGATKMLRAVVRKGIADGDANSDPSDTALNQWSS